MRLKQKGEVDWYELKEFREGIYSVAEARKDAYQAFIQIQQIHIRKFRKFAKKFKILRHKTSQIQYKFSQDLAFWNFYCLKNLGAVFCKRCELQNVSYNANYKQSCKKCKLHNVNSKLQAM